MKIAFLGAGSTVFARNLIGDILSTAELADSTLALHDIDAQRLRTSEVVAHKVADTLQVQPRIEASLDRRRALDGADVAISMFQVGGYAPCTVTDFEVPKRFGVRQTIGDSLGLGGIMRGLRTIPVLADMLRDMQAVCPAVTHLNYVNPMAINCWAASRLSPVRTLGLCHSVQGTAAQLAGDLGVPADEVDYLCAGINHLAFYLRFEHRGRDLYPQLKALARNGPIPDRGDPWRSDGGAEGLSDAVRYRMLEALGYFVTESSEHFAEYVPWFIKPGRDDLIERYGIPLDEYPRRCERQLAGWEALRVRLEDPDKPLKVRRSNEYGATIIRSLATGEPSTVYGNLVNNGLIGNLPDDCVVEVPCNVDAAGIHPQAVGDLPPQLTALMQTNINVQRLTVEAALTGQREHVYHAAMFDPLTAAHLDIDAIHALVDDLLDAHGEWLPDALR